MEYEIHDCLVVKNDAERIPVRTSIEGLKILAEIHGASNILNFDGSPYLFPAVALSTVEVALSTEEAVHEDEDKPKRKIR